MTHVADIVRAKAECEELRRMYDVPEMSRADYDDMAKLFGVLLGCISGAIVGCIVTYLVMR